MAFVYSCCFWFSLRLGGILIGLISTASAFLACCCFAYTHSQMVTDQISEWNNQYNLIYSQEFIGQLQEDPEKYISLTIVITCIYLVACVIYIYGAYICNNILMLSFIILELLRLLFITALVATGLLLLKQNTMDIGSLIGASVVGGFFLLGMFYLWICAANLPILINEMERDDQAITIAKLQQILEADPKQRRGGFDNVRYGLSEDQTFGRDVFLVSNRHKALEMSTMPRSQIRAPY